MSLFEDLRFAFRVLAKRPWLTAMMALVLAAGIGVNTTVFTLFNAALVRSLPFPEGDRILFLESVNLSRGGEGMDSSYPDFADFRDETKEFESLAAFSTDGYNISDDATTPELLNGARVTANAFRTLRVKPVIGRDFAPGEDQPGADAVVLLSHGIWQDRYGADPAILGETIRIDEEPHTVIGVMPQDFRFPTESVLWLPLAPKGDWLKREFRGVAVVGRLAEGATLTSAQGEMDVIATRLRQEHPETNDGIGVQLLSGNEKFNGGQIQALFIAMLGAVGFVLMISCANVANVQLMRAADREREISIRTALGAGRWRIVRQLLIESVALSTLAGIAGLGLSLVGVRLFDIATAELRPYFVDFRFDATVFSYLALICLLSGILFGLAPVVHALRTNVSASLKDGARGQTGGKGAGRFSTAMVIGQVALSTVLLVAAGLMVRSFWNLYRLDLGVKTENRLIGLISLPQLKYPEAADRLAFFDALMPKLQALPGVQSVTSSSELPGQGYSGREIEIEGAPPDDAAKRPSEAQLVINTDYFRTLGATLIRGRDFTPTDTQDAPAVAIVNQGFAQKYWPGEDAVGKRLKIGNEEPREWITVVGVSPDIRQNSMSDREVRALVYRPFRQAPSGLGYLVVHTHAPAASMAASLRSVVAELDPNLPVQDVMSLDARLERSRWGYRVFGSVFSVLAAIALAMAALGVFALVADSVRRRVPEFGVRLAMGAAPGQILRLVLSQAMRRVAVGVALGLPAAYFASRMLQAVLVGVDPSDAATLGGVTLFLTAIALAACWLPARRVVEIDPASALRNE
jgi:predicted permease